MAATVYFGLLVWVIFASILTFAAFGLDKLLAILGWWRLPERILFVLAALGGILGAIAGMWIFKHKRAKSEFTWTIVILMVENAFLFFVIWWMTNW